LSRALSSQKIFPLILIYAMLIIIVSVYLFPFIWMILSSIKSDTEQYAIPPVWLPLHPTLNNYRSLPFRELLNSLIIALTSTGIAMLLGSMAGYGFARYRFPLRSFILFLILMIRVIPHISILIPIFLLMKSLNLLNTILAVIMVHLALQLPLCVWMMRSFFVELPRDLEDAAKVDGCSSLGALIRVVLPVCTSGLAATAIIIFLTSWNEFLFALVLTYTEVAKTMPVAIAENVTAFVIHWGPMTAASVIYTIPVMIFTIFVQKHIVRGLTLGAIKG